MRTKIQEFYDLQASMPILRQKLGAAEGSPESLLKWLEEAREAGMSGSDEDIIKRAKNWSRDGDWVFEGQYLDGIFVEARPTLFNSDWELNKTAAQILCDLAVVNGKEVIVISDTDCPFIRVKLRECCLPWSTISRRSLKGAILNIVVKLISQSFPEQDKIAATVVINVT